MITQVLQNGIAVSEVQPNTPIQLSSGGTGFWTPTTRFVVFDSLGNVVLDTPASVNFAQNAWYDWIAPNAPGEYHFYGNYDNDKDDFAVFTVATTAPTPIPGGGGYLTPQAATGGLYTAGIAPSGGSAGSGGFDILSGLGLGGVSADIGKIGAGLGIGVILIIGLVVFMSLRK